MILHQFSLRYQNLYLIQLHIQELFQIPIIPKYQIQVFLSGVASAHLGENLIVPGLEGQVDAFHDVRMGGDHLQHVRRKIPRVARHEAKTRDARLSHLPKTGREIRAVMEVFPVAIHVLAQESDFLKSFFHQAAAFFHDVF